MEDNEKYTINITVNTGKEIPECYSFHEIPTPIIKAVLTVLDKVYEQQVIEARHGVR